MQFVPLDEEIVLNCRGVYRVAPLFSRNGLVFAKFGSGFVGLYKPDVCGARGTTKVGLTYEEPSRSFNYTLPSGRLRV
jgi:hypothetical protein